MAELQQRARLVDVVQARLAAGRIPGEARAFLTKKS